MYTGPSSPTHGAAHPLEPFSMGINFTRGSLCMNICSGADRCNSLHCIGVRVGCMRREHNVFTPHIAQTVAKLRVKVTVNHEQEKHSCKFTPRKKQCFKTLYILWIATCSKVYSHQRSWRRRRWDGCLGAGGDRLRKHVVQSRYWHQ